MNKQTYTQTKLELSYKRDYAKEDTLDFLYLMVSGFMKLATGVTILYVVNTANGKIDYIWNFMTITFIYIWVLYPLIKEVLKNV